jgi:hypothetical protein
MVQLLMMENLCMRFLDSWISVNFEFFVQEGSWPLRTKLKSTDVAHRKGASSQIRQVLGTDQRQLHMHMYSGALYICPTRHPSRRIRKSDRRFLGCLPCTEFLTSSL